MKKIYFRKLSKVIVWILTMIYFGISINSKAEIISKGFGSPQEKERIEIFLQKNSDSIPEEDKEKIKSIRSKLEKNLSLTQEEIDYFRECQLKVIKNKLGDSLYEEYCKLILKRKGNGEFLPPERMRLLEIEKILNN